MTKTNYPEELTNLVEEYLTDGIISTKERQVLLNKAKNLGVDVDEFDLYIDAQQQKVDQAADSAVRKAKGKTCPYCGRPAPQLAEQCPHCGQFITVEASAELEEILEHLENALIDFKAGKDINRDKAVVEKYSRKARMYYSSHPKVKAILAEIDKDISVVESNARKQALINGTMKNKWFWCIMPIVIGVIMVACSYDVGLLFILGGIYFLYRAWSRKVDAEKHQRRIEWWDHYRG